MQKGDERDAIIVRLGDDIHIEAKGSLAILVLFLVIVVIGVWTHFYVR